MQFTFDLISDLHIDTWDETFDWSGRATSAHAVVVGDLARDRSALVECLAHLGRCYQAVFYVDGNTEHADYLDDLNASYQDMIFRINTIPNVVYLQDNVVVIDGVAILGTNGWWGYDFDGISNPEDCMSWHCDYDSLDFSIPHNIRRMSANDATYMVSSVRRLQTHIDVKKIVVVTHTVPKPELISHDVNLDGTLKFNTMGNRYMNAVLDADTEKKVHTWCFGHYHGSIDQYHEGVRYVNNCRGRGDTRWSNWVYHPKRITIEY